MTSNEEDELLSLDSDSDPDDDLAVPIKRESNVHSTKSDANANANCSTIKGQVSNGNTTTLDEDNDEAIPLESESDDSESRSPLAAAAASRTASNAAATTTEVILSEDDDEDNDNDSGNATGESSTLNNTNSSGDGTTDNNGNASRYGLRRKRKINYTELENGGDPRDMEVDKQRLKKEIFDVFSLPTQKLTRFTQKPELVDNYTRCTVNFMDGTDTEKINAVSKLFEKCGHQFEAMFIHIRYDEANFTFLKNVFKSTTALGKLGYRYHNQEDAYQILKLLKSLREQDHLPGLHSLKLVGLSGEEVLRERHMALLSEMNKLPFRNVELGDGLWEDVKAGTLEKFLEAQKSSLESLIIQGGFRGDTDKARIVINFPRMERLTTLCICPSYTFLSEIKNPHSKKARVITLGGSNREEPYKIAIKFSADIPTLERLVLGNLIEIEDLAFSSIRKLIEFRCGSYWNLSLRFPAEGSRKALMESTVTSLQFPDALKDPSFPVKVSKHFPHLKKVWMFLPSVPVLRAFFKAFEDSELEELYLKTQFDFESTMESCLLPRMSDILRKNQATETLLQTLKEYKHFDEYVRYYNVELPVEAEDLMEGHSAGIGSLKNLKVLHLEHIPRRLLIPIPDDERKWYDHNCKFMSSTFGYERYPMNYRCHREILKLNLNEYIWKNIQISSEFTEDFYQAGFVDISDVRVIQEFGVGGGHSSSSSYSIGRGVEEDIFTTVERKRAGGAQVKIMPSMLFPDVKIKPEGS